MVQYICTYFKVPTAVNLTSWNYDSCSNIGQMTLSLATINQINTIDEYNFVSCYLGVTKQPPGLCLLVFLSSMSIKRNSLSRIFIQLSKTGKTKEQLLAIRKRNLCFCLHVCRPRQWGWRCRCEAWPLDGSLPRTHISTFSAFDRWAENLKLEILIRKYKCGHLFDISHRMKFAGSDWFVNGKQLIYWKINFKRPHHYSEEGSPIRSHKVCFHIEYWFRILLEQFVDL